MDERLQSRRLPELASWAESEDVAMLDASADVVFGLLPDLRIGYVNRGWLTFARDNGGECLLEDSVLGTPLLEVLASPLRPFYRDRFEELTARGATWTHEYECPSPSQRRTFLMRVLPLANGPILVANTLVLEQPWSAESVRPTSGASGSEVLMVQCAHCRTTRSSTPPWSWRWDPTLVRSPPAGLSHGLCPPCFVYHYPDV